jgi:hypothetical protein
LQIAPGGELVDTTAEDPSAPPNRIQGSVSGDADSAALGHMLKPAAPEQTPDMVLGPLAVGQDGRARAAAEIADEAVVSTGGAEVMELGPVVVPRSEGGEGAPAAQAASPPPAPAPEASTAADREPGMTQAFVAKGLRVIVFAAASDAQAPAYDGIVIEPLAPSDRH